jgi:glutathione S-transferase
MSITLYELVGANDLRFSPFCWRTRMALAHKQLSARYEPCRFQEKEKLAFSGQDRIPVLVDGDTVVSDSWDIACYLEETYPDSPSLFGGDIGRGEALFFNEWIAALQRPILKIILKDIHDIAEPSDQVYFRKDREERFGATLEEISADPESQRPAIETAARPLRAVLAHQPWFSGPTPAYADYIVFGSLQFARCVSDYPILEESDPLYEWRARMLDLYDGLGRCIHGSP